MSFLRTASLVLPLSFCLAAPVLAEEHVTLDTDEQRISYAFGVLIAASSEDAFDNFDVDYDAVLAGLTDALEGSGAQMTTQEAAGVFQAYLQGVEAAKAEEKIAAGLAFLEENANAEGVTVTESGLQYKVLADGEGDSPTLADTVVVHYTGRLLDGTVFDSSLSRGEPARFPVSGVIPGWTEALQLMKPGTKFEVWIPSELAYGPRGAGQAIGPNEILNFEMELLEIVAN